MTLIQLISDQTVQNLLPILRLKPRKLVHLVTSRTAAKSAYLKSATHAAGIDPELEVIQLSGMPGIQECFNVLTGAIKQSKSANARTIVNFTGGTKLMSIGAYAAARIEEIPSLYVDTQDVCFVDGGTSMDTRTFFDDDWSFTPIRNQLRVDVLAIANGVPRVTSGKPWKDMLPLAEHLFHHEPDEVSTHRALHGPTGLFPRGCEPRTPKDWNLVLDQEVSFPLEVAKLAVESGLVRAGTGLGNIRLPDGTRSELQFLANNRVPDYNIRYFKAVAPIQHAAAFLTGAWWEIIVCDAAERSGLFRDLRWSAQVGDPNGPDTEEDVLGVDGVELLYINCKRGGEKSRLLPLLEEVKARAATIGGAFNRRFLAVHQTPRGRTATNLERRAAALGIRLITGDNVYRPNIFAR